MSGQSANKQIFLLIMVILMIIMSFLLNYISIGASITYVSCLLLLVVLFISMEKYPILLLIIPIFCFAYHLHH